MGNKKTIMNFDPGRMSLVVDGTEEIYIIFFLVGNFATEIQIQNIMNAERDCWTPHKVDVGVW